MSVDRPNIQSQTNRGSPSLSTDIALLAVVFLWGSNFSVINHAVAETAPLVFTALRFVLGAIVLCVIVGTMKVPACVCRADYWPLMRLALMGHIIFQPLFVIGLARTGAADSAIIIACSPLVIAATGHLTGRERLGPGGWVGVLLSFSGVSLVILGGKNHLTLSDHTFSGDLLTVIAMCCWAAYTLMLKRLTLQPRLNL
jgi:drug/metabolite transporter (DMT)-like permease